MRCLPSSSACSIDDARAIDGELLRESCSRAQSLVSCGIPSSIRQFTSGVANVGSALRPYGPNGCGVIRALTANGRKACTPVIGPVKMLRNARMADSVKPRRAAAQISASSVGCRPPALYAMLRCCTKARKQSGPRALLQIRRYLAGMIAMSVRSPSIPSSLPTSVAAPVSRSTV